MQTCKAKTKKGKNCSRKVKKGEQFCWQHKSVRDKNYSEKLKTFLYLLIQGIVINAVWDFSKAKGRKIIDIFKEILEQIGKFVEYLSRLSPNTFDKVWGIISIITLQLVLSVIVLWYFIQKYNLEIVFWLVVIILIGSVFVMAVLESGWKGVLKLIGILLLVIIVVAICLLITIFRLWVVSKTHNLNP